MKRVAVTALAVALMLAGCARESYRPKPLDPDGSAAALAARSLASGELRRYLEAQGRSPQPWPRQSWDLSSLTLAAVFHHPEIEVARARARLAAAEKDTSKTRLPYTLTARPEFNDKESGGDTPWGIGVLVGLPLDTGGKRQARTEQLERIEEAAKLEIAVATWRVRSRLRRHFVDLYVADRTHKALEAEHLERGRLLSLMERRLTAGMVSAADVSALRIRQAESDLALRRAAVRQDQAMAGVAEAVGVPLAELERVEFDFAAVSQPAPAPEGEGLQRTALTHRIDLRRKLADYASAEAAVKLEVARQYPDITLAPGYFWDADESIWSVAVLSLVPPTARTRALIREAELRREIEAKAFVAIQSAILAEAQAAASRYRHAVAAHAAAQQLVNDARERKRRIDRQFERGYADRVDVVTAALETAVTERAAIVATLEMQQGLSALEDAVQRPLDNPDLLAAPSAAAVQPDPSLNPALLDND